MFYILNEMICNGMQFEEIYTILYTNASEGIFELFSIERLIPITLHLTDVYVIHIYVIWLSLKHAHDVLKYNPLWQLQLESKLDYLFLWELIYSYRKLTLGMISIVCKSVYAHTHILTILIYKNSTFVKYSLH